MVLWCLPAISISYAKTLRFVFPVPSLGLLTEWEAFRSEKEFQKESYWQNRIRFASGK